MERKGKISLILMFFGILATVSLLESTRTFSFAFADTNFVVAECPVVSNGDDEESGKCPDMKTTQNEGERSGNEQSDTRPPTTSGLVNPFGP